MLSGKLEVVSEDLVMAGGSAGRCCVVVEKPRLEVESGLRRGRRSHDKEGGERQSASLRLLGRG